jgi:hypothetical protein
MTFGYDDMLVTQPIDPYQGQWHIEPTDDNMEGDLID